MNKIKIYCDTGADITQLRRLNAHLELVQFPYDSSDRPKKPLKAANPSAAEWRDINISWEETDYTFEDFTESLLFEEITTIHGKNNRRDILHLDSAYKTGCEFFLTSDKGIWQKRHVLEELCGFQIFITPQENDQIIARIHALLKI